jgi:succinoglycan biosynthesis protein ExoO
MAMSQPSRRPALEPDVSFVIAAYNADLTIERAVRSALAQQGVGVEVIVVDDRSQDCTVDVVRSMGDDRIRLVSQSENRGPGGARNAGLRASNGRWVAILDADDAVHPERMARLISRAERCGATIVVDNVEVARDADRDCRLMFSPAALSLMPDLSLADFIDGNLLFKSKFNFGYMKPVFDRRFVEGIGLLYDETLRIGEDYLLLATALARGGVCAVEPEAGYTYHITEGSISRVLELHHVEDMIASDAAFLRANQLDPAARAAYRRRARSLADAAAFLSLVRHIKEGSPLKALEAALRNPGALGHLRMPIAKRLGLDRLTAGLARTFPDSNTKPA